MKNLRVASVTYSIGIGLFWFALESSACLNEYGTEKKKKPLSAEDHRAAMGKMRAEEILRMKNERDWASYAKKLEPVTKQHPDDFRVQSDQAVALLHLGKTKEALDILVPLQRKHPREYTIAANLGTAYELNGEDEKALTFIRKGRELNPDSHHGTEWLHERILEAKLLLAGNPHYLKDHSVLGVDFGQGKMVQKPKEWKDKPEKLNATYVALNYQLTERLQFVAPPDKIVADLLYDYGNLVSLYSDADPAPLYALSLKYDPELRAAAIAKRKGKQPAKKDILNGKKL